jgi:hypothetical protein
MLLDQRASTEAVELVQEHGQMENLDRGQDLGQAIQ